MSLPPIFSETRPRRRIGELLALEAADEIHGLGDPRLQFGEGLFLVRVARNRNAGQPRPAALGKVGGNQHLPDERQHVREKPGREQRIGIDLAGFAMGLRLLQDRRKRLQGLAQGNNGTSYMSSFP